MLESYFPNRMQLLKINKTKSHVTDITFGVAGVHLRPISFLLMCINDWPHCLQTNGPLYTDDTNIFVESETIGEPCSKTDRNISKTSYIMFLPKSKNVNHSSMFFLVQRCLSSAINKSRVPRHHNAERAKVVKPHSAC